MPSDTPNTWLKDEVDGRRVLGTNRDLVAPSGLIDFSSNDYLGFARSAQLADLVVKKLAEMGQSSNGSTGSRLISGHSELFDRVERTIAQFHGSEAALIFNSGYDANIGLISCIADRHDTILIDELCHASIYDGARLSLARKLKFVHNEIESLRAKIKVSRGKVFVVVESLYSMDGDKAPLREVASVCAEFGCYLIIDEAHATGVLGPQGRGLAVEEDIVGQVFARVFTFGKALGSHGAAVAGSNELKDFLINFARPLIYSTALPRHSIVQIEAAYELIARADKEREQLTQIIKVFKDRVQDRNSSSAFLKSDSAIQGLVIPGNFAVQDKALRLRKSGFDVRAIRSPTVASGQERLRLCLHSFNTASQVEQLWDCLETRQSI
jgi:8-amino-7-oxononanoate synthase